MVTYTWKKAEELGRSPQTLDVKADYQDEVNLAIQKAIARAWTDQQYKKQLIANPTKQLADLGVYFPDQYDIEFYDDPSAKVGDWAMTGKNGTSILRVPIPPEPAGGNLSTDDLKALDNGGGVTSCCSSTGMCGWCAGATSRDSWY
jgi:hypothetical protein